MSKPYSYPSLPADDIVQFLRGSMQINCSTDDIANPTPEWFLAILQTLGEIALWVPTDRKAKSMDFCTAPDIHEQSVPFMIWWSNFKRFCKVVGIPMKLKMLQRPEPKAVRKVLSGMINFCRHREERDSQWSEKRNAIEDFEGKEQQMNEEITQLEAMISQIEKQASEHKGPLEHAKEKERVLHNEITQFSLASKEHMARKDKLDIDFQNTSDAQAAATLDIQQMQKQLQDANAQIIHEPEQALLDLNNRKMTRKRVEHKMSLSRQDIDRMTTETQILDRVRSRAEGVTNLVYNITQMTSEELNAKHARVQEETNELRSREQQAQAEISNILKVCRSHDDNISTGRDRFETASTEVQQQVNQLMETMRNKRDMQEEGKRTESKHQQAMAQLKERWTRKRRDAQERVERNRMELRQAQKLLEQDLVAGEKFSDRAFSKSAAGAA